MPWMPQSPLHDLQSRWVLGAERVILWAGTTGGSGAFEVGAALDDGATGDVGGSGEAEDSDRAEDGSGGTGDGTGIAVVSSGSGRTFPPSAAQPTTRKIATIGRTELMLSAKVTMTIVHEPRLYCRSEMVRRCIEIADGRRRMPRDRDARKA
jgi:hypothetical protein